ncbi:hypothetical protein ABPG73_022463 [Tetrahymena malaccensis]
MRIKKQRKQICPQNQVTDLEMENVLFSCENLQHQNIIDYVGSESLVYEFQQNQASAHLLQNINLAHCLYCYLHKSLIINEKKSQSKTSQYQELQLIFLQPSAVILKNQKSINLIIISQIMVTLFEFMELMEQQGKSSGNPNISLTIQQQSCIKQGVWRKTTYLEASEGVSNPNSIEYIQIPQKYQYLVYLLVSHKLYRGYKGKSEV